MMSAKTVLTEAPASNPAPAAPSSAANAAVPGGAPSDFQNLLAGAVPPIVEATLVDTLPPPTQLPQPLVQLLTLKNQQLAAKLASAAGAAPSAQAAKPAVSPADLLEILGDSATLVPEAADLEAAAPQDLHPDTRETDEPIESHGDILAEWLDVMLPSSVFAAQAGSTSNAGAGISEDSTADKGGSKSGVLLAPIPPSLVLQAGLPEQQPAMESGAPAVQGAAATLAINREAVATAAQNAATVFTEGDAPTSDNWMSAMGDLTTKRAPDFAPAADVRLPTPVHDARWADALAHRLVLMAREGESVASLKLVPVDLGPLDIQISVRDGEASVHFGAAHQETRAVLEASMPRLRELLSAQGLQLANASVSHQSAGQNRPERSSSAGAVGARGEETEVTTAQVVSTSLLDLYA